MKVVNSSVYLDSVRTYLTMPKDIGFDYMETLVEEISDAECITWTEAYEFFGAMCDKVIMEKW